MRKPIRVVGNVRDWLSHNWSWIQLLWRRDNLHLKLKYPKLWRREAWLSTLPND